MANISIMVSQFTPPANRMHEVSKRMLNKKLKDIPNVPLTLIHAGAGYGKSTALASFAADFPEKVCWYSLSKNDDDIIPFLTKMAQAIKQHHPSFGAGFMRELAYQDGYVVMEDIYTLVSTFINDVMQLHERLIIILDDFHHAADSGEIESWLLLLLEHRPDNLHIVLSTRQKPHWDIVATMKVKGDILEISQDNLLLELDEMQFILEDVYGLDVAESDVTNMHDITEGWAIAFNMLAQQLALGYSLEAVLANRQWSLRDLFEYLASEVLSKQPAKTQTFLLRSSALDVLTAQTCDAVLDISDSASQLSGLAEENLFIAEGDDGTYRYHSLFKAFLENRLYKTAETDYYALHERAADYFTGQDNPDMVLYHHQKRGDDEGIARLLTEHGRMMLQAGRLQTLYDLLTALPDIYKLTYPVLYFFQGEIERYRSLYEAAELSYEQIISIVPDYDHAYYGLIGKAFEGKARIYLDTIQPYKAERYIKQTIDMQEQSGVPKEEMGKLYLLMAENLLNSGFANKAEAWLARAQSENLPLEESNLQPRILLRTGKVAEAKATLEQRKAATPAYGHKHLPQAHRETDILLSIIDAFMGNAEASKQQAEAGIDLGLAIQSPFVEACGWIRMGHAALLLDRYDQGLAQQCYETALDIMETINVSRGKAEPYMGLSILYATRFQFDKALIHARNGLEETEKVNDRWLSALNKIGIGLTDVYREDYESASATFQDAQQDLYECGDRYVTMVTAFWLAYIADQTQDDTAFETAIKQFLKRMEEGQYEFFLTKRTLFGPVDLQNLVPILLKAQRYGMSPQYLPRLLEDMGIDEVTNHPGYTLIIDTFGGLTVRIGKKEESPRSWQREKAKELLGLLVTNRDQLLLKSDIYQALWPHESEEAANKKFKVTFNALLKILEPNRQAREEPYFISREGSTYRLNTARSCELDVMSFERQVKSGLKEQDLRHAKDLLEKGLELYQGPYLADLRNTSWSQAERDRLELLYLHGAEKLAQLSVRLLDFTTCIEWCEQIITIDQTWEEAYRLIMYSYYQKNNRPQAIRWYDKCCDILKRELAVDPMAPTQEMYNMIIGSEHLTN